MVLDLLLIGLAVTLDPLPLSAFLVVPPSKRGVPCAGDYSRSILRSPCVGVHHSTTSIVAFSLRCVCTTSAMSA
jgi:hypothetical protein